MSSHFITTEKVMKYNECTVVETVICFCKTAWGKPHTPTQTNHKKSPW